MKTFGCASFPFLTLYNQKFDFHSSKCILISYSEQYKGYKCFHPFERIYIARHVIFNENEIPYEFDPTFRKLQIHIIHELLTDYTYFHIPMCSNDISIQSENRTNLSAPQSSSNSSMYPDSMIKNQDDNTIDHRCHHISFNQNLKHVQTPTQYLNHLQMSTQ